MYYYAIINEEYVVMEVVSSATTISDPSYIEITEEQYNDEGFLGMFYDQDKNEFVGYIMWMATTNEVRYDETYRTLTGKLNEMDEEIATHTHTGYVSSNDLQVLEDIIDTKADSNHSHSEYATANHLHDEYVLQTDFDVLGEEVNGKASTSHSHTEYATSTHEHENYAEIGHNHNSDYAPLSHSHVEYATTSSLNELSTTVSGKADASHTHDDRYYTETEIDTKLVDKADSSHTHTGVYDVSGAAASALSSANTYTDSKIDALVGEGASTTLDTIGEISSAIEENQDAIDLLNAAIGNKANVFDLTSHANDTEIHITDAERESWNAKSNFSGNYNDLTNKPAIPSINGLATEVYVDEKVDGITAESIGALSNTTVIPTVPTNVSAFTNDVGYLTEHQSLTGLATETYVNAQIDAIDIPDTLSDLTADSTHRTVTDAEKSAWNAKSNFSGSYNDLADKPTIPSISGLATETYVDEAVSAKANSSHTHTIANVNGLQNALDGKSDSTHNHNSSYDVLGAANTALTSAKEYTDDAIADEVIARDSAIATAKSSAISTAASDATTKANNALASAKTYADSAVTTAKNDLLNGAGTAYDTLKELGDLIDDNVDAIEALETVAAGKANASHTHTIANITNLQTTLDSKASTSHTHTASEVGAAASSHTHGDIYYTETEIDSLLTGKANSSHTHTIGNVSGLQTALDGKAATSHGTHVSFSTTAPVMDGSANVGTATTVARSDHKHPTDTSRAAKTELDALTTTVSGKANASHTHTIANVTNLQSSLDGKADSGHTHGAATTSAAGFMTAAMVTKLNGIATGANAYAHPTYTARTGVPTANQTPAFGGTFTVSQPVSDGTGHITAVNSRTITIPSAVVTTSANGLMSASDKSKLDGMVLATVSEVETYLAI